MIDAAGATALPGLVDSHTHIFNLGASLTRVSLYDVDTEEEAVARIVATAADVPAGEWIVGHGWDEGAWANRYPDMTLLSERVPTIRFICAACTVLQAGETSWHSSAPVSPREHRCPAAEKSGV